MFNYQADNYLVLAPGFAGSALLRNILTLDPTSSDVFFKRSSTECKLRLIKSTKISQTALHTMHIGDFDQIGFNTWDEKIQSADECNMYVHHGHIQRLTNEYCKKQLAMMTTIKAIVVLVGSSQCLDLINYRRNVQGFGPIDNTESFLYNAGQEYLKSFYNIQVVHSLKFSTLANPDLFCEQQVPGMKQLLGLELPGDQIYNIINHWRVKNFGEIDK
jgi:hypothetical protein